jgi:outer membrane protein OmpA-like peptidoglycan-associated protein
MNRRRAIAVLTVLVAFFALGEARAQSPATPPSAEDVIKALTPKTGFGAGPGGTPGQTPIFRDLRGLTVQEEEKPPSIDLYVAFEFDSDRLTNDSLITLNRLGTALADPRLATYRFRIAGHTDAKGSFEYNQKLSERRAAAVRNYIVAQFRVAPDRLESIGYGKTQLADPAHPEDGINRRVQVVNIGAGQ